MVSNSQRELETRFKVILYVRSSSGFTGVCEVVQELLEVVKYIGYVLPAVFVLR